MLCCRQKNSSIHLVEELNMIKLNLERAEATKFSRLEGKNDALEKEVSLLRKKIDAEQADYKQSVQAWEVAQKELSSKLEETKVNESSLSEKLSSANALKDELSGKLSEAQEKLELAESAMAGRGVTAIARQDSAIEGSAKVRDLQLQLSQVKNCLLYTSPSPRDS